MVNCELLDELSVVIGEILSELLCVGLVICSHYRLSLYCYSPLTTDHSRPQLPNFLKELNIGLEIFILRLE